MDLHLGFVNLILMVLILRSYVWANYPEPVNFNVMEHEMNAVRNGASRMDNSRSSEIGYEINVVYNIPKTQQNYSIFSTESDVNTPHFTVENFQYARNVKFFYYDDTGQVEFSKTILENFETSRVLSYPSSKVAIIVHGFSEDCGTLWVTKLVEKLHEYRRGRVICMDYGFYAKSLNYLGLMRRFSVFANILNDKLQILQRHNVKPSQIYMFGFSFGGQLVCEAGKLAGRQKIGEIVVCDNAGIGFDAKSGRKNHRQSAQFVQCLHTSNDKGTKEYNNCHQNWRLGDCGRSQPAASDPPFGSHGLCPYFYVNSFDHKFCAIPKPKKCKATEPANIHSMDCFEMGYRETRRTLLTGELFVRTTSIFPYNDPRDIKERTTTEAPGDDSLPYSSTEPDERRMASTKRPRRRKTNFRRIFGLFKN